MIISLIVSLCLTLIIELIMSLILGVRDRQDIKIAILANFITNPVVVYLSNCVKLINNTYIYVIVIMILEITAVITEFMIYKKYLKFNKISLFYMSLINNVTSFVIGLAINIIN